MTVSELKALLAGHADDTRVIVNDEDGYDYDVDDSEVVYEGCLVINVSPVAEEESSESS